MSQSHQMAYSIARLAGGFPAGAAATLPAAVLAGPTLWLLAFASTLFGRRPVADEPAAAAPRRRQARPVEEDDLDDEDESEDRDGFMVAAIGAATHWWLSAQAFARRKLAAMPRRHDEWDDEDDDFPAPRITVRSGGGGGGRSGARIEPGFGEPAPDFDDEPPFEVERAHAGRMPAGDDYDDEDDVVIRPTPEHASAAQVRHFRSDAATRVEAPAPRPLEGARVRREAQRSLIGPAEFELPSLHFLSEAKNVVRDPSLSQEALEQNARLLEGVLEDFGVKGEIIHVRPGPVVTLYELEPAPGIKSSRVIGLADDIARSMSAIACRVAVVPGRNAIGIELPNARRETVYLRELLASRDFEQAKAKLALALGKTINGEAVIVDIAIDQGGCSETSRPTTHAQPTFVEAGVVHYCVANMPGGVPETSTAALTNATLPYVVALADRGWQAALAADEALAKGLNAHEGVITNHGVHETFPELAYTPYTEVVAAKA